MFQFLFYHHCKCIITNSLSSVYIIMHIITTLKECQQSFIPLLETISLSRRFWKSDCISTASACITLLRLVLRAQKRAPLPRGHVFSCCRRRCKILNFISSVWSRYLTNFDETFTSCYLKGFYTPVSSRNFDSWLRFSTGLRNVGAAITSWWSVLFLKGVLLDTCRSWKVGS